MSGTGAAAASRELPMRRECPFSPPAEYARMREESAVSEVGLRNGSRIWALTRDADIRAMLTDPRFSSDDTRPGYPVFTAEQPVEQPIRLLINLDGAEHNAARRRVISEYTARRIRTLRPGVQRIVDRQLDRFLAGPAPADLVAGLAVPVPALVISDQLGVGLEDTERFLDNSTRLVSITSTEQQRDEAFGILTALLTDLVARKEAEPSDDLLGRQVLKLREDGCYDRDALVGLAFLLLVAGHETTASMISLGAMLLLQRPDVADRVRKDPSRTSGLVEELLRWFSVGELAMVRAATDDVEIEGTAIRPGDGVIGLIDAANRDPEAFDDPDVFDIDRRAPHLAFGHGPHQCLGASLARLELQVVLDSLLARAPGLHTTVPFDRLRFRNEHGVFGLEELPVSW